MSSTNSVNFSVRQNKAIERELVFSGITQVMHACSLRNPMYVGFGSVWFADFILAHRRLGVADMHSIEADPIIAARAKFNRPFRSVRVHSGPSSEVLPMLLARKTYMVRPWIVWLDYDRWLKRGEIEELDGLISALPDNSFIITTFSTQASRYGNKPGERSTVLGEVLGYALDPVPDIDTVRVQDNFSAYLPQVIEDHFRHSAISQGRDGGYIPSFRIGYKDGTPMATVGGFLPSKQNAAAARSVIESGSWDGRPDRLIATPPLTSKEAGALMSQLPSRRHLTRADVQRLGFDLEDDQIELFEEHYLRYPTFVQVAT